MPEDRQFVRARALKPRDSWWTVLFVDAVTIHLLPGLLKVPGVTPMRLSLLGLAVGAVSVWSFASGWLIAGALLFQLRYVIDCLDGKVARVRGQTSAWGAFADLAIDVATVAACYAALGYWALSSQAPHAWTVLLLLVAYTISAWVHLYRRLGLGETERTSRPATPVTRVWARSRFRPYPASVEVETALLVFFPLLAPIDWYAYVAGAAALFYLVSAADGVRRVRGRLGGAEAEVGGA